jgi:uncharacterized protein YidB (DUF937 family)
MFTLIQFIMRLLGISKTDLMEKVFKNVVLGQMKTGGSASTGTPPSGGKNPLEDLMGQFTNKGMGDIFASWVGKGPNKLISAEQVTDGLGPDTIAAMAKESGLPPEEVSKRMATLLPTMIDRMTPDGAIPQ